MVLHRAGRVDENRHRGSQAFFDFRLIRRVGLGRAGLRRLCSIALRRGLACDHKRRHENGSGHSSEQSGERAVSHPMVRKFTPYTRAVLKSDVQCGHRFAFDEIREMQKGQSRASSVGGAGAGVFRRFS